MHDFELRTEEVTRIQEVCSNLGEYAIWARASFVDRNNPDAPTPNYGELTQDEIEALILQQRFDFFLKGLHEELGEVLEKTEGPQQEFRVDIIRRLLEGDSSDLSQESIKRLKNEFGDVMWYLANMVEYRNISGYREGSELARVALGHWEKHDIRWGRSEDEKALDALKLANPLSEYLRAHLRLRGSIESMYINLLDRGFTKEDIPENRKPRLKKRHYNPNLHNDDTRHLIYSVGEYIIALDKILPALFGPETDIKEITDMNIDKLTGRKERGTIHKTEEIFGDNR